MTASGGDKASSPHFFFVQSCPAGGASLQAIFFAADAAPRPGGMAPAPYAAAPGPLGPAAVSGAGAPCGRGRPRGGGPPAPGGGGLGQLRYAAGRVQAGPVLARPGRPRPIAAARPCPAPARAPSPPLVWAGGWRRGARPVVGLRPVSLLAAWVRGAAAPPPGRSAVVAVARSLAAAAWAWGWRPGLRPCRRLRLNRPPPAGAPPAARRRGGGGPLSGARPWFSLGWSRPPLGGPKAPRPRTLPYARARRHEAARATGVWCLAACGRRWNGAPPAGCGPPPPHEGGWGLDSAACGRRGTSTGRKGVCGKPGKGVLHDDDPHFSELFEGLKNASAWRKDFFATLKGGPEHALRPSLFTCGKAHLSARTKLSLVALTPDRHGVPCLCAELISSLCGFRPVKAASVSGRSE